MRKVAVCLYALWIANYSASPKECPFPLLAEPSQGLWAQQYTGADLLRERLKGIDYRHQTTADLVAIWDTDGHGELVGHILTGPYSSAVIPLKASLDYHPARSTQTFDGLSSYQYFHRQCRQNHNCPTYINHSMTWAERTDISQVISQMNGESAITVVTSAGNDHHFVSDIKATLARQGKLIVVASLDPRGWPSLFTSYSDAVTIAAPSDNSIESHNFHGEVEKFGGTSGATPLVTGSLAAFTLITDYALSTAQAIRLLQKTAIPLPLLPVNGSWVGSGMINAYKIGAVADRLNQRCRGEGRDACMAELLQSQGLYQFGRESEILFREAVGALPDSPRRRLSCNEREALAKLRMAALLDPSRGVAWRLLGGQLYNGTFYRSLAARSRQGDADVIAQWCQETNGKYLELLRYLSPSLLAGLNRPHCTLNARTEALIRFLYNADSAEIDSSFQASFDGLLGHPHIDADRLYQITSAISSNVKRIPHPHQALNSIISHPRVNSKVLVRAMQTASRTGDMAQLQHMLENVAFRPGTNENVLHNILTILWNKAGQMANLENLVSRILLHPSVDGQILSRLTGVVAHNPNQFANALETLGKIRAHSQFDADGLAEMFYGIAANADHFPGYRATLDDLASLPQIDSRILTKIIQRITVNAHRIPHFQEVFERAISHPQASVSVLDKAIEVVSYNTRKIPHLQGALEAIISRPNLARPQIQQVIRIVSSNAESNIFNLRKMLITILQHPQADGEIGSKVTKIAHFHPNLVPNLPEIMQMVKNIQN